MKFPKIKKFDKRPKTKEELLADLRKNADFLAKMKFVKEQFYPALCASSTSIQDAQMLLEGFNHQVMESFLGFMKEKKVKDLGLEKKLDTKNEKAEEFRKLLALFEEMSVFDAKSHLENMKGEIAKFLADEAENRPLSDLKTKWLDEL